MNDNMPDIETIKARQKATWMAGDFGQIAKSVDSHAKDFIERRAIRPGLRVLDVACGTGNAALHAARAGADVTGVDIATNLVQQARERAAKDKLRAQFDEGDAEDLPYPDASFDLVVTMYGAMFAPRPEKTAAELVRVCRPGGHIAMANWTPTGFSGLMFKVSASHVPPPAHLPPPVMWGVEDKVRERFSSGIAELEVKPVKVAMKFPFPVPGTVEHFRTYFGPTQRAFAALDPAGQAALRADLEAMWAQHNRATDGTTHVESEYLEVVAKRS
jgi:SAM-dependent methyltransferase